MIIINSKSTSTITIEPIDWEFGIGWLINDYIKSLPNRKFLWSSKNWVIPYNPVYIHKLNSFLPLDPFTQEEQSIGLSEYEKFMNQFN